MNARTMAAMRVVDGLTENERVDLIIEVAWALSAAGLRRLVSAVQPGTRTTADCR